MGEATGGKDLLLSKSFLGAIILVVSYLLKFKGVDVDHESLTTKIVGFVDAVLPYVGLLLAFIGGVFRKQPIKSVAGISVEGLKKLLPVVLLALLPLCAGCCGCRCVPRVPRPCFDGQCVDGAWVDGHCVDDACQADRRLETPPTIEHRPIENRKSQIENGPECPDPRLAVDLPPEVRAWYRNPDGSCVQCSGGMCGQDQNVMAAATLLWKTDYGPAERGGSGSSRVSRYCKERGIRIWNVTGKGTIDWMKWACRNGRGAAIGAGGSHFQTLMGHDPQSNTWWVCNNNSTDQIDEYDDAAFRRLHAASGPWMWVLDYPPHPWRPRYVKWW